VGNRVLLSAVACVIQRSCMSRDLRLKNHRTSWKMGTRFPKYSESGLRFCISYRIKLSDVTHNLCVGTNLFWVIQLCYNVHVKWFLIIFKTRQSNTSHFNKWHCTLLHGILHFLGIEARSDVECRLLNLMLDVFYCCTWICVITLYLLKVKLQLSAPWKRIGGSVIQLHAFLTSAQWYSCTLL
jgi:hypothetical protein